MNVFLKHRSIGLLVVFLSAVLIAGCDDKQESATDQTETDQETVQETAVETVRALTEAEEALVAKMATVAKALEEAPATAGAVLESSSMTMEEYEKEIYRIAADPALSEAFEKAKNK
ncbi:MAG: hypothetical protein ABFS42_06130 [Candidatus Krumholzibacteriota bacterium]